MPSPNITASTMSKSFMPKKEIPLTYGKSTVYVYPSITEGMPNAEKSYTFMMNKSVFATADIKIKTKIQAFANSLNSTPLANIVQAKFIEHATTYITSTRKFTVDSYHGRNGLIIPDCLDVEGNLRPTSGEPATNRRPKGIQYVKLLIGIKFVPRNPTLSGYGCSQEQLSQSPQKQNMVPFDKFRPEIFLQAKEYLQILIQVAPCRVKYGDEKLLKGEEVFCQKTCCNVLNGQIPAILATSDFQNTYAIIGFCGIDKQTRPLHWRIHDQHTMMLRCLPGKLSKPLQPDFYLQKIF
eukprot:scaffold349_cov29-Attheya_sp.AAC.1